MCFRFYISGVHVFETNIRDLFQYSKIAEPKLVGVIDVFKKHCFPFVCNYMEDKFRTEFENLSKELDAKDSDMKQLENETNKMKTRLSTLQHSEIRLFQFLADLSNGLSTGVSPSNLLHEFIQNLQNLKNSAELSDIHLKIVEEIRNILTFFGTYSDLNSLLQSGMDGTENGDEDGSASSRKDGLKNRFRTGIAEQIIGQMEELLLSNRPLEEKRSELSSTIFEILEPMFINEEEYENMLERKRQIESAAIDLELHYRETIRMESELKKLQEHVLEIWKEIQMLKKKKLKDRKPQVEKLEKRSAVVGIRWKT